MSLPTALERRRAVRAPLNEARRRFPRLRVQLDAFWETASDDRFFTEVEISLRGVFFPCRLAADAEGTEGIIRVALPDSAEMLRARGVVLRRVDVGTQGMAVRFIDLSETHRARLAAYLLRAGGLSQIPALDARFKGWARLDHPFLRREQRRAARG